MHAFWAGFGRQEAAYSSSVLLPCSLSRSPLRMAENEAAARILNRLGKDGRHLLGGADSHAFSSFVESFFVDEEPHLQGKLMNTPLSLIIQQVFFRH